MTREPTISERKLVDIAVQLTITAACFMHGKSVEEIAQWTANQLDLCGYKNTPCGGNWAYLTEVDIQE